MDQPVRSSRPLTTAASRCAEEFSNPAEFQFARDLMAGLLLFPADVNRDSRHERRIDGACVLQPQVRAIRERESLTFGAFLTFSKAEQTERRLMVQKLA